MSITSILLLIPYLTDNYILGQNQGNVSGVQTTQMYHYFNSDDNVSMNYPSTWSVNETDITPEDRVNLIAEFVSPFETYNDTYIEYVQINRDDGIFYEADLNEYLAEAINTYKDIANNFTLIESSTSDSLSGRPAYSLTFTEVLSGEDGREPITLKNFETGILLNNTAYFVTYVGQEKKFDRYFPIVEQMIHSFKLLLPASYDEGLTPPLVTNLNTSAIGLEKSITGTNETSTTSTGSNLTSSNQILPNNLTNSQIVLKDNTTESASKEGDANLSTEGQLNKSSQVNDTRGSENAQLKKDKTVDIQIKATEKDGFFGTVSFVPNEIAVDIGTNIVWTNNHSSVHTVTAVNNNTLGNNETTMGRDGIPLFDSDYMNTGDNFSYNFTQPGRFDYFDKNNASLKGVVFVKQAPSLINNTSSLLHNENTSPSSVNPISNDFGNSDNNKSGILDKFKDINNSSTKSNNGTLSQLVQSLHQIINR